MLGAVTLDPQALSQQQTTLASTGTSTINAIDRSY